MPKKRKKKSKVNRTSAFVGLMVYAFLSVVVYLLFLSPNAYAVYLGENRVAAIFRGEMDEDQFRMNLIARISAMHSNSPIVLISEVKLTPVRANLGVLTPEQALNIAISESLYYIRAASFIIEGEEIVTVSSHEEAMRILYEIANRAAIGEARNISSNANIVINNRLATDNISSFENALNALTSFRVHVEIYTVSSGESLWSIALFANSTVEEILSLNPGVTAGGLYVGQTLTVPIYRPILTVSFEDYSIQEEEIEDNIKKEYEDDTSS